MGLKKIHWAPLSRLLSGSGLRFSSPRSPSTEAGPRNTGAPSDSLQRPALGRRCFVRCGSRCGCAVLSIFQGRVEMSCTGSQDSPLIQGLGVAPACLQKGAWPFQTSPHAGIDSRVASWAPFQIALSTLAIFSRSIKNTTDIAGIAPVLTGRN